MVPYNTARPNAKRDTQVKDSPLKHHWIKATDEPLISRLGTPHYAQLFVTCQLGH
jgi:hypothetical protein